MSSKRLLETERLVILRLTYVSLGISEVRNEIQGFDKVTTDAVDVDWLLAFVDNVRETCSCNLLADGLFDWVG